MSSVTSSGNMSRQGFYAIVIMIGVFIILQSAAINGGEVSPFGIGLGVGFVLTGIYSWVRNLAAVASRDGSGVSMRILPRSTADGVVMAVLLIGSPVIGLIIGLTSS